MRLRHNPFFDYVEHRVIGEIDKTLQKNKREAELKNIKSWYDLKEPAELLHEDLPMLFQIITLYFKSEIWYLF